MMMMGGPGGGPAGPQKYSLTLSINFQNVLNHVNLGSPVGNLSSPSFGQSLGTGGMFGFFLLPQLAQNYSQVMASDGARFNRLFHGLLDRGIYIAPALYEAGFVTRSGLVVRRSIEALTKASLRSCPF